MSKQTAIITGGNAGLGFQCARVLASEGWHVVIACRDAGRGAEAAALLRQELPEASVAVQLLDLASLASVRRFAAAFTGTLDALICNAGIQVVSGLSYTEDGFETTFAVNHLGHFLLVELMKAHQPKRVVVVASGTHDPGQFTGMPEPRMANAAELAKPPADTEAVGEAGRRRYTTSKLCNILFSYELARRAPGVVVAAFDPGLMPGSGLARDYGAFQRWAWRNILPVLRLFQRNVNSTESSGRALARLATDPGIATGTYYEGLRAIRSSTQSYDEALAARLWSQSEALLAT
ncbi:MAG: Light-dependent protochlorophyllide reductase [Cyanobacteria bacterium RYN_339]|nr:Light-dependent protochlorophyllide reductase [Cyanobacteria bacterium RYN_339]